MQANLETRGEVNVLHLSGRLNLTSMDHLYKLVVQEFSQGPLVISLANLKFVGSTGITVLLDLVRVLYDSKAKPVKFCNLNSEYNKVFLANLRGLYEAYDSVDNAILSFTAPVKNYAPVGTMPEQMDEVLEDIIGEESGDIEFQELLFDIENEPDLFEQKFYFNEEEAFLDENPNKEPLDVLSPEPLDNTNS